MAMAAAEHAQWKLGSGAPWLPGPAAIRRAKKYVVTENALAARPVMTATLRMAMAALPSAKQKLDAATAVMGATRPHRTRAPRPSVATASGRAMRTATTATLP